MTNKLKDRAARCVTHHAACDCREYAYRERIERLGRALRDMLSGWKYIRSFHGDLYGVGWDRAQQKAEEALADDEAGGNYGVCSKCEGPLIEYTTAGCPDCDNPPKPGPTPPDNTPRRDAREAAVKAAHFQYFMNKAPFEEAVKTALRTADVLLPAEPAPPTVPESIRNLPLRWRLMAFGSPVACANELDQVIETEEALAQHSEPGRGETCPVCEKGTLTRVECCICDNCDATPVLTDQICRNDKRLAARSGRIPEGLSFAQLRAANVERCETAFHALDHWNPMEWGAACAGEVGEGINAAKKLRRVKDSEQYKQTLPTTDVTLQDVADEIADAVIYADLWAASIGVDLGASVADKFNRTSEKVQSDVRLAAAPAPDADERE